MTVDERKVIHIQATTRSSNTWESQTCHTGKWDSSVNIPKIKLCDKHFFLASFSFQSTWLGWHVWLMGKYDILCSKFQARKFNMSPGSDGNISQISRLYFAGRLRSLLHVENVRRWSRRRVCYNKISFSKDIHMPTLWRRRNIFSRYSIEKLFQFANWIFMTSNMRQ